MALVLSLALGAWALASAPTTLRVEAEEAGSPRGENQAIGWEVKDSEGAGGGKALQGNRMRLVPSARVGVTIPQAGRHRLWIRYYREKPACAEFSVLLRDESGEEAALHLADWSQFLPRQKPYEAVTSWAGDRTGWIWEPFDATFERPMRATMEFGHYRGRLPSGIKQTPCVIDMVLLTTDLQLDPTLMDLAALGALPPPPPSLPQATAPAGMMSSLGLPASVAEFSGIADPTRRFQAGMLNHGSTYFDLTREARLGFTHDHHVVSVDSPKSGIMTMGYVDSYYGDTSALTRQHPAPEGRFVNFEGKASKAFSFHFPPVVESAEALLRRRMKLNVEGPDNPHIYAWRISTEDAGMMDYSTWAVEAFRKWLQAKHGDIATLNQRWGTDYQDFAAIQPPATFAQGRACWLELRDFASSTYVQAVARQIPVIREMDPLQRPCLGATSSLMMFAPFFTRMRPLDFDELVAVALKNEPYVSWDSYCADDQLACETDLLASMAQGRKVIIQEWNNHAVDPRIAARSYWTCVSKGAAGVFAFKLQEGTSHVTYPKWGLLHADLTPKAKMGAYSDAVHEVHRLEPMLMAAARADAVKPVALYWSRLDLSVAEPFETIYGCAQDSPIHVYRVLRSLGYPVRWITPRQVRAGQLKEVSALVLVDCQYIPRDVATAMRDWVAAGGVIAGDSWPGAWDEYGQPQDTLSPLFGVRKVAPKNTTGSTLAVQESTQGYGEVTDNAVDRQLTYTKLDEIAHQPGATHPVAKAIGEFMVSGIAPSNVECVAGDVVAMSHRGEPGFVINTFGKGHALYSSLWLGTIWESGGTRYEWDTTHAGLSYHRLWGAFLKFADVQPGVRMSGLSDRVAAKVRVEWPLVTPEGNLLVGLTSMNDQPVQPFDLDLALPAQAHGPFVSVLVTTGGSRRLQVVQARVENGRLRMTMPRFDTHAMVLALRDAAPLVALEITGLTQGQANLHAAGPNESFQIVATVFNPSPRKLPAGEVTLSIPAGWLQNRLAIPVGEIAPGQNATATFTVRTPQWISATRLRSLLARYHSGHIQSTPATEMIWWRPTP
jgi:hypothetical protein